jgi:hypothetical protein
LSPAEITDKGVLRTQRAPPALHLLVTVDLLVLGLFSLFMVEGLQQQTRQAHAGFGKYAELFAEAAAAAAGEAHGSPAASQPARTRLQGSSTSLVSMNTCHCMTTALATQAGSTSHLLLVMVSQGGGKHSGHSAGDSASHCSSCQQLCDRNEPVTS